ncbi:unnamed protein product [Gemmataceae bacterium]|nr:unnamed protein product [Gemmataceae bacterium]VTT97708.1 unnamed protein product [Gemmataceae bacterium]
MIIEGTVVNGVLVFDGPPPPDGARLRVELADADSDLWDELARVPPPPTDTYEEHLEALRRSIAEMKAGVPGRSLAELATELKKEFGLPPEAGK